MRGCLLPCVLCLARSMRVAAVRALPSRVQRAMLKVLAGAPGMRQTVLCAEEHVPPWWERWLPIRRMSDQEWADYKYDKKHGVRFKQRCALQHAKTSAPHKPQVAALTTQLRKQRVELRPPLRADDFTS